MFNNNHCWDNIKCTILCYFDNGCAKYICGESGYIVDELWTFAGMHSSSWNNIFESYVIWNNLSGTFKTNFRIYSHSLRNIFGGIRCLFRSCRCRIMHECKQTCKRAYSSSFAELNQSFLAESRRRKVTNLHKNIPFCKRKKHTQNTHTKRGKENERTTRLLAYVQMNTNRNGSISCLFFYFYRAHRQSESSHICTHAVFRWSEHDCRSLDYCVDSANFIDTYTHTHKRHVYWGSTTNEKSLFEKNWSGT